MKFIYRLSRHIDRLLDCLKAEADRPQHQSEHTETSDIEIVVNDDGSLGHKGSSESGCKNFVRPKPPDLFEPHDAPHYGKTTSSGEASSIYARPSGSGRCEFGRKVCIAIYRKTRWVFARIYPTQTAAKARRFLRVLAHAATLKITWVLTDNGSAFTDRLFGLRKRAATGQQEFDQLCADLGIEHPLTRPKRPPTNGMLERFNCRIEDVLQCHRFHNGEDPDQTILRYVALYNQNWPQKRPCRP